MVGSLPYWSTCTRPDISQAVGVLASHMAKPSMDHRTATKAVLRYIAGTSRCGTTFRQINTLVGGYSDTDYAGDSHTEGPLLALSSSRMEELSDGGAD